VGCRKEVKARTRPTITTYIQNVWRSTFRQKNPTKEKESSFYAQPTPLDEKNLKKKGDAAKEK